MGGAEQLNTQKGEIDIRGKEGIKRRENKEEVRSEHGKIGR